jgi:hypothetical protein
MALPNTMTNVKNTINNGSIIRVCRIETVIIFQIYDLVGNLIAYSNITNIKYNNYKSLFNIYTNEGNLTSDGIMINTDTTKNVNDYIQTFGSQPSWNGLLKDFNIVTTNVSNAYITSTHTYTNNPITYDVGYFGSNIYWSYLQGTTTDHINYPPVVESPNTSFTLSNPGATFTAFTLSKSFIDTVNLNDDWFCCFKLKRFIGGSLSFMIYFDSKEYYDLSKSGWYYDPPAVNYVSAGQDDVNGNNGAKFGISLSSNITISGPVNSFDIDGSGITLSNGSIVWTNPSNVLNDFNNGMYISLSKNENLKKYSLKLYKNDGTLYLSIILNVTTTNSYNRLPFHLYHNTGTFKYYDGFIWYNSDLTYNQFQNDFKSGITFT